MAAHILASQQDQIMSLLQKNADEMGSLVPEYVKHIKAFLAYEGDNPKYHQKAKVSAVGMGAYVKAEGTLTNRLALKQQAGRSSIEVAESPKELQA